jgi:mitochondrial enoyl-[acyl-carrier protein] reductase / trans-2-enoyl-CoA reductase
MESLCLQFDRTGPPAEVLKLVSRKLKPLGPHEVRVRMRYSPVNPADLNFVEGSYGIPTTPPAIPGHEGCGEVEELGSAVESLEKGDLVIPIEGNSCWAQHATAAEHHFAKLPEQIDRVQASMLRINPLTAWRLLKGFMDLEKGDVIAQNAANSGVGRALIQIAKQAGVHTINFVRRPELIGELKAIGADSVFLDNDEGLAEAKALLKKIPLRLAANAVGGDSAIRLMDLLSPEGTLVTYGAMSRQSLKVPNKFLIFKNLQLRGLWITKWVEQAGSAELYEALHPLAEMVKNGELAIAVDEIVPLKQFTRAISRAQESGRRGKVILDLAAE